MTEDAAEAARSTYHAPRLAKRGRLVAKFLSCVLISELAKVNFKLKFEKVLKKGLGLINRLVTGRKQA